MRDHHGTSTQCHFMETCPLCRQVFPTTKDLAQHGGEYHPRETCAVCQQVFTSTEQLLEHSRTKSHKLCQRIHGGSLWGDPNSTNKKKKKNKPDTNPRHETEVVESEVGDGTLDYAEAGSSTRRNHISIHILKRRYPTYIFTYIHIYSHIFTYIHIYLNIFSLSSTFNK